MDYSSNPMGASGEQDDGLQFLPAGLVPLMATQMHTYQACLKHVVQTANRVYTEFRLSEAGQNFKGQVCLWQLGLHFPCMSIWCTLALKLNMHITHVRHLSFWSAFRALLVAICSLLVIGERVRHSLGVPNANLLCVCVYVWWLWYVCHHFL